MTPSLLDGYLTKEMGGFCPNCQVDLISPGVKTCFSCQTALAIKTRFIRWNKEFIVFLLIHFAWIIIVIATNLFRGLPLISSDISIILIMIPVASLGLRVLFNSLYGPPYPGIFRQIVDIDKTPLSENNLRFSFRAFVLNFVVTLAMGILGFAYILIFKPFE